MSDTDTLNQSEEQIEEQNINVNEESTEEQNQVTEESSDTSSNDDTDVSAEDEDKDKDKDSDEENKEPSIEELDALSDEDFTKYLETGKLPDKPLDKTPNAKIISKPEPKPKEDKQDTKKDTPKNSSKLTSKQSSKESDTNTGVDYENVYKAIFKPFKANGKEITPKTVEDVISLMQMGANYTKKMQLLSPMKKTVESINRASITESDLNFLIDIHKGDKEAIKQLLQKHKIDPLDINMDEESTYVSNNKNIATDKDVEFSDALLDVSDSLPKIREILDTKWDSESKRKILQDPRLMTALHEEIQFNRFDKVQEILEREKTFGRYKGVPDVDAYIEIVTNLVQQEKAKQDKARQQTTQQTKQENKPTNTIPDKNKAAPTRTKTNNGKSTLTAQDIWNMPEEEFNKLSARDLV